MHIFSKLVHCPVLFSHFLLALGFPSALTCQAADKLDGDRILRNTLELYSSAGYYSCNATVEEEVTVYQDNAYLEQGLNTPKVVLSHNFSLEFTRPSEIIAYWTIVDGSQQVQRTGSLSTAEDIYILGHQYPQNPELTEEPDQFQSLDRAIDYSEFASLRVTALLREFLNPAFHEDLFANEIRLTGTRRLGKLRCYVLRVEGYKSMTIYIDRKNFALAKIDYATDYGTLQGEAAWLDWKLNQAQLALDSDADRIQNRISLYRDPPNLSSTNYSLLFQTQSIQP
ncbi:hypothetical protein QEH53_00310 [Pelagicoccus sp. SDUM812002]|nr:hypothetical protein [Pelagicoccus sp. SDUM812002]